MGHRWVRQVLWSVKTQIPDQVRMRHRKELCHLPDMVHRFLPSLTASMVSRGQALAF